ncbi:DUF7095 family protein [Natrialbaceae archaeon A-gly3]
MNGLDREKAVERVEEIVDTVEDERMPVPVREVWVYGDLALGVDPVDRVDIYLTKDILLGDDRDDAGEEDVATSHGIEGVGSTVRADWAVEYPEYLRTNAGGYAAPEECLAAHLLAEDEPVHLEVCNASFEDNVTQRLRGAQAREDYTQLLDPRGVCLWVDGQRSAEAFRKLRAGDFALPTLEMALEMLGMDTEEATAAADELTTWRAKKEGVTVRGDVV